VSDGPNAIPALSVGGIRRGVYLIVLSILQTGFVATWVAKKFGFSTRLISIDDLQAFWLLLTGIYSAFVGAYVGFRNILTRVQVGKDPSNPAPPIQTPGVVKTLVRWSR
jgi:hypothetical protein